MNNTCICCGDIIPEGRQVCPKCEHKRSIYNGIDKTKRKSLCCDCSNMKCVFMMFLKPVPGWTAKRTKIKNRIKGLDKYVESYHVIKCPEFKGGAK